MCQKYVQQSMLLYSISCMKTTFAQQKSKWLGPWQSGQQCNISEAFTRGVSGWAALWPSYHVHQNALSVHQRITETQDSLKE
jgi:hypothetical protein